MAAFAESIEKHHKPIILVLLAVILFFLAACIFHDVIPICHWVFRCDHRMHAAIETARILFPA